MTWQKDLESQIREIGEADVVVGIPSYNNARTIGHVVKAVQVGLAKYFPDRKSLLVNSDGGSTDGTTDVVNATALEDFASVLIRHEAEGFFMITTPYSGVPGKGSAFRTIFEIATRLRARACVVVDADLRSITPEWIEILGKPVTEGGYDFVAPLYQRHKYDGTITNSVVYPLTRALYGKRVRQPIGGDFGVSGRLVENYLGKSVWDSDVARYGVDIWMTTTALAEGYRVCQGYLGAKIHDPKDPGADLSTMLFQVVGATFDLIDQYSGVWKAVDTSEEVPTLGFHYHVGLDPVPVNVERMIARFRLGVNELSQLWRAILPVHIAEIIISLSRQGTERFNIPDEVWAEIVYHFALSYCKRTMHREHLLKSLTPLYVGRTASFIIEVADSTSPEVEEKIEGLCRTFEEKKQMFVELWNGRKGAKP